MKKLFTFLFVVFLYQFSHGQITNTKVVSKLHVDVIDGVSVITPKVSNTTDVYYSLRYDFSIIEHDSVNNINKESKEDLFVLGPFQTKELSQMSINSKSDNKIIAFVLIYDDEDNLLAKDRLVFNDDEKVTPKKEVKMPRDGLVLLGLVTDQTKTKFGKDFYDFFYFYYTFNNVKGEKVVNIGEERSFGRTTKVTISIEEDIVMQFITRPDQEYLEEMAKTAVRQVFRHFLKLKQEKSYITQY